MDNNVTQNNSHPWLTLSTVTTFDRGNSMQTTIRIDNNCQNQVGGQLIGRVQTSTSLLIESLIEQLCTLFEGDPKRKRKLYLAICRRLHELKLIDNSYNVRELDVIKIEYQRALYHLVALARASTNSENALQVPSLVPQSSRYHTEFREIGFIARGGFGAVFKALNRLDNIKYAIKKIAVSSDTADSIKSMMHHLEEVRIFANLSHTNIVAYKSAWIEAVPSLTSNFSNWMRDTRFDFNEREMTKSRESYSYNSYFDDQFRAKIDQSSEIRDTNNATNYRIGEQIIETDDSSDSKKFNNLKLNQNEHTSNFQTNSDVVSFRNDSKNKQNSDHTNSVTSESGCSTDDSSDQQICRYSSNPKQDIATLYIQMELCDETLQQWLKQRTDLTPQTMVTTIMNQILNGVNYMHSKNIVHHDIKPSNIFISTLGQLHIRLGDFGLACPLRKKSHDNIIGTHMYAAPEQLQGKCNPKSDIYSIGIVLSELLILTQTVMEQCLVIDKVKRGEIPPGLDINYPKWAPIISQLIHQDPDKRPSASQLLQDLHEDKDATIAQLKLAISKKDDRIQMLEETVSSLQAKITERSFTDT